MNSKPRTSIDDIMFPGEQARTLGARIDFLNHALSVLSATPAATELPPQGNGPRERCVNRALEDCTGALSMRLSNGETIQYRLVEIYGHWNAYDDNDTSGSGGWGPTKLEAIRDLRERCERESCDDGRARVVSEPQRRDAEFRRIVAGTQL